MTPLVSFLIPVKNVGPLLDEAVASVRAMNFPDWEIIIVDDHSEDDTYARAVRLAAGDPRIKVVVNPGQGIVSGLNAAYAACTGGHVKFLDGDDVIGPRFADRLKEWLAADASYHDAVVVDENLAPIGVLRLTDCFKTRPYASLFRGGVVSPPRWAWTLSRRIAEGIFPLPALPSLHEDYWIALIIKKTAARIIHFDEPLYLYRQRPGQIFGGLYNFSPKIVRTRAEAMIRVLEAIRVRADFFGDGVPGFEEALTSMKRYYSLMSGPDATTREILGSRLPRGQKLKLWVVLKCPRTAAILSRFKSGRTSRWLGRLK
jgi:glycosyltransferase involved in cell wall biosynthesis